MAHPIPCIRCEEQVDSSWLLTARDELTGLEPGTTLAFCQVCWLDQVVEWATALLTSPSEGPEGPSPTPEHEEEPEQQPAPKSDEEPDAEGAGDEETQPVLANDPAD